MKLGGHSLNSYIGGLKTFVQLPEKFWRRFGAPLNEKSAQLVVLQLVTLIFAEREGFEPITLTAYISATLLSKFQIGNETVTIFRRWACPTLTSVCLPNFRVQR